MSLAKIQSGFLDDDFRGVGEPQAKNSEGLSEKRRQSVLGVCEVN